MQRYRIGSEVQLREMGIRWVGGVGEFDVFWIARYRRLVVKWVNIYGKTCPVSDDGSEEVRNLSMINAFLERRGGPVMTEEEHGVLCAIRQLFVVELETS